MVNQISFAGLKGLSSPENKNNLALLNKVYGDNFMSTAEHIFGEINSISADKDVFLHTEVKEGFAKDSMHFYISDEDNKKVASSSFKMGVSPDKYGNTPGMRKALTELKANFERNFVSAADTSRLNSLIDTYS